MALTMRHPIPLKDFVMPVFRTPTAPRLLSPYAALDLRRCGGPDRFDVVRGLLAPRELRVGGRGDGSGTQPGGVAAVKGEG